MFLKMTSPEVSLAGRWFLRVSGDSWIAEVFSVVFPNVFGVLVSKAMLLAVGTAVRAGGIESEKRAEVRGD